MNNSRILLIRKDHGGSLLTDSEGNVYRSEELPETILSRCCISCGSTLKGRRDAAAELLGIHQKVPVMISERSAEIWFPLASPSAEDCIWVCWNTVLKCRQTGPDTSEILFMSGYRTQTDFNIRVLRNQMKRSTDLFRLSAQACTSVTYTESIVK